jgi:hypothetical protein
MTRKLLLTALLATGVAGHGHAQIAQKLAPDFANLQYAGSNGWIGAGIGYNLFRGRFRAGLQYGYVPPEKGGSLHLFSGSLFYRPLHIRINNNLSLNPFDIGVKGSYQFGKDYFFRLPARYPANYYWWKPAFRLHLATESSVTFKLSGKTGIRSLSTYIELNTNDLYLVSYFLNARSLTVGEVVKAGIGLRVNF